MAATAGLLLAVALLVTVTTIPARAALFSNAATISIPAGATTTGPADPYPSTISVSGLSGTVTDVNVTITGITHTFPDDLDVIVVGPAGQRVRLMTDTGGGSDVNNVNLTFDDAAASVLPDEAQITTGSFRPTFGVTANTADFNGPAPAPAAPYSGVLSSFNGTSPIGTWSLYVFDDQITDTGLAVGGWSLNITTNAPTITSFNPTSGTPGTVVAITGTNFSGTTAVRFGGVAASVFTENSATSITATVPIGAVTGPISVTTPLGTGVSATNFTVNASAPTISQFNPVEGQVGDQVTISGTNFTGATSVTFNGTTAAAFNVNSDTQITATVPTGASTGPIAVTTAGGTATSTSDFVVRHARHITLNLAGSKARGNVTVDDGFSACASNVPVKLTHKEDGHFRSAGSTTTAANGSYSFTGVTDPGKYRAIAKGVTLASGDVCVKAKSPIQTN